MFFGLELTQVFPLISAITLLLLISYEFSTGKFEHGKKNVQDWKIFALSATGVALVERPLLLITVLLVMKNLFGDHEFALSWVNEQYLIPGVIGFVLLDEFLHGGMHFFTHSGRPQSKVLARIQRFYKEAHRAHHILGDNAGRGELNATQAIVAGWGWMFFLPNYWMGYAAIYLGMIDIWFWGILIKTLWGAHVHTNWKYDLYLLNHKNPIVRRAMWALCHIFTFPNQHHQHHSRGKNSAKNMQNFLALWDWLAWKTLVIETKRPEIYGWRQNKKEEASVLYRYFNRSVSMKSA